jgi:hypothetical protein
MKLKRTNGTAKNPTAVDIKATTAQSQKDFHGQH